MNCPPFPINSPILAILHYKLPIQNFKVPIPLSILPISAAKVPIPYQTHPKFKKPLSALHEKWHTQ
ncbi:hypothetical protein [Sporosarcina aquimarina]|uniref:hypothetical protein n=1 Tax=Sporosarcina aquimarina TaxID=114975 RepID=UPI00295E7D4D|nr:hypothetical protein [Sporosarcina aquimarina]